MLGTTQAAGIFSKSTTQATRPSGENTSPRMGRRLTRHRLSPSIIINSTLLTSITTATSKTRGTTQAAGIFSKSTTQAPPLYLANTSRPTGPLLTLRCLFQPITTSNISRTLKRTAISRMRGTTQGAGISNKSTTQALPLYLANTSQQTGQQHARTAVFSSRSIIINSISLTSTTITTSRTHG